MAASVAADGAWALNTAARSASVPFLVGRSSSSVMAAQERSVVLPVCTLDGHTTSVRVPATASVRDLKASLRVCFPPAQAASGSTSSSAAASSSGVEDRFAIRKGHRRQRYLDHVDNHDVLVFGMQFVHDIADDD